MYLYTRTTVFVLQQQDRVELEEAQNQSLHEQYRITLGEYEEEGGDQFFTSQLLMKHAAGWS